MPLFSAGLVRLQSGNALVSTTMQPVPRVTNVKADYSPALSNVMIIGRAKPLEARPVINYTPVDTTIEFYHSDNQIPQMLGLVNSSHICSGLVDTKAASSTFGMRNMQVAYAPTASATYNGLLDFKSGVLTSFSLQGSVGDPVKGSFAMQFLDVSGSVNNTTRDSTNLAAALVKPEGMSLTGILFTGYGITGMNIQSFTFSLGLGRTEVKQLGSKFPVERPLTEVNASLQVNGYFDGVNSSMTGLSQYDCGNPTYGTVGLTMIPACSTSSASTITMKNPYLTNLAIDSQAGGFSTVSITLDLPIGPNPAETTDGSTVTMT